MSVIAYTGLPGSGKTYSVVQYQVLPALRAGRHVVSNLPLKKDLILAEMPDAKLTEFSTEAVALEPQRIFEICPPGCVLILDEVWRLMPAGLKVHQVPESFKAFFAEHRHHVNAAGESTQIVLVTQDLAQIGAFARQLVEQTFRTTKLTALGLTKRFRVDIYPGPVTGPSPSISSRLREIQGSYDKRVYQYYVSHTKSQAAAEGADERAVDRRGNIFFRPLMIACPFVIVGLIWFGVSHLLKVRDSLRAQSAQGAAVGRASDLPARVVQAAGFGGSAAPVVKAPVWRVVAVFSGGLKSPIGNTAVVSDGEHERWISLLLCRVSVLNVECPVEGHFVDWSGVVSAAGGSPVASYSFGGR